MLGLFVTGIDTGIGKTYVTSLLARAFAAKHVRVGVYKPVCSGAAEDGASWPDLQALANATDGKFPLDWICPQRFRAPLAPPVAARLEGKMVDSQLLRDGIDVWRNVVDLLLVEGVGGWMCPLSDRELIADLARDLGFPVLIVTANRLGMISQTLLTAQSIKICGLPICGAVVNQLAPGDDGTGDSNADTLRPFIDFPLFGPLPWSPDSATERVRENATIEQIIEHGVQAGYFPSISP